MDEREEPIDWELLKRNVSEPSVIEYFEENKAGSLGLDPNGLNLLSVYIGYQLRCDLQIIEHIIPKLGA